MTENNESGNRWEAKPEENAPAEPAGTDVGMPEGPPAAEPIAVPAAVETAPVTAAPVAPAAGGRTSRLPGWVTTRGLLATGAAAAIFVGGAGIGYAIGESGHHDDGRQFPGRFDRADFDGDGGQFPGGQGPGGQAPGGQNFGQGPQTQSQGDDGSDSGTSS